MKKKKIIYTGSASILAASAIITTTPAEAASVSEAEKLMKAAKDAGTILKWAISIEGNADGKTRPWAAYNNAKAAYDRAVKAANTLPSAQKNRFLAELDEHVKLHINRTMYYIDAITAGEKIKVKQQALTHQLNLNLINDQTELAYHELSREIRKQAIMLDRVYGKSTRDLIRSHYKQSAEKVRDSAKYAVTVKIELDLAQRAISSGNFSKAETHLREARTYLPYVSNLVIKKTLTDRLNSISAAFTPKVDKVSAAEPKRIKVTFSKAMLAGTGSNGAENLSNYYVSGRAIKNINLSADKRTAVIELYEPLYTNSSYTVTVKKNIQTVNYESLGQNDYVTTFTFSDKIKPTITTVKTQSNGNVEVTFSELIAYNSPIAVTIDGKAVKYNQLNNDTDTIVVPKSELDRISLRKGRSYSIVVTSARDLVVNSPNTMDNYRSSFLYNPAADTTPPEVKTLQVKDEKTFTIEFTETVSSFTASSHLTIKKGNTTIKPVSVKDISDGSKTKFDIELPASVYGANEISARLNISVKGYKDLEDNTGKTYDRTITINKDLSPPQFVQAAYEKNKNEIHITFNKTLKAGLPTASKIKVTDKNNKSVQATVRSNIDNKMILDAEGLLDGNLTISVAEGAVKDNTLSQNNNRAFTTSITKKADQKKPEVVFYETAANGQFKASFDEPVHAQSATSAANYLLNGRPIPLHSVLSISNDLTQVTITFPEGTIASTTKYNITASGIKDLSDNIMNPYTAAITLGDNTEPVLNGAILNNNKIHLTFSESIFLENSHSDFIILLKNNPIPSENYSIIRGTNQNELTILPEKGTTFEGGSLIIKTADKTTISDEATNKLKAGTTVTVRQ